jgi:hypothetical protein
VSPVDDYTRIERRPIQGREVRVGLDPDEIRVEWRPGRAAYYGVRVGDRVKDADADVESVRIDEWEVREVTPERVVGEHVRTGERHEWDRRELETGLVIGRYATNLSTFELVTAIPVGSWDAAEADAEVDDGLYHGRPYVTVVAYGNNGEKYGRRYWRGSRDAESRLEPWNEDLKARELDPTIRAALDETVRTALSDDGYEVPAWPDEGAVRTEAGSRSRRSD